MHKFGTTLMLSAHDLVGNLYCAHLTGVDLQVALGVLPKPARWDPLLDLLRDRGRKHEQAFLDHLRASGFEPLLIEGVDVTDDAVARTREAMRAGHAIIVQAALRDENWPWGGGGLTRSSIQSLPAKPKAAPSYSCAFTRRSSPTCRASNLNLSTS